ncbi:MAG TPA: glycosyltransferase [Terriglobales bacterium]|nr:glycosyltransferase [Terriglobales bacterium]
MQILYLALDCPLPANNGLRMRTAAMLSALRAEGCRTTLVCLQATESLSARAQLQHLCEAHWILDHRIPSLSQGQHLLGRVHAAAARLPFAALRFRSAAARTLVQQLWDSAAWDALICDTVFSAINVPARVQPLIVNHHNLEHRIFDSYCAVERHPLKRAAARWESRRVRAWEAQVGARSSGNLVCSEVDREGLLAQQPGATVVVAPNIAPNIAPIISPELPDTGDSVVPERDGGILFQGALDWLPNRDAVEYLLAEIWPRVRARHPMARLKILGRNPPAAFLARHRHHPGVEFTGSVPDTAPYLAEAAISVVPLRIGSGTRLKILEAAAMGKAVVSTTLGAEGLKFLNGEEILLADAPDAFAASISALLASARLRRDLGRAAHARVQSEYSLDALRCQLRGALQGLHRAQQDSQWTAAPEGAAQEA